jgi:hypothetical protein
MYNRLETIAFTAVYTLALVVMALDLFYWRPF